MKKQEVNFEAIPDATGVYYFWDIESSLSHPSTSLGAPSPSIGEGKDIAMSHVLYIGKATSLRNRVKSYFDKDLIDTRGLKIVNMVLAAKSITFQITDNVMEALLLENILIKRYKPYYNTREKDNKSYSAVIITDEDYPRVLTMRIREYEKRLDVDKSFDKAKVYGPFTSAKDLRETLKIIRRIFPYRDKCATVNELGGESATERGCFNYQIGLCPGVCVGAIDKTEYNKNIRSIKYLFEGKSATLIDMLKVEMNKMAKNHDFEGAAKKRDAIYRLTHVNDVALINNDDINEWKDKNYRIECYDVAHISGHERVGVMTVVEGGKKKTDEYRKFKLEDDTNDDYAGIRELIRRRMAHTEWQRPDLIVFDGGLGQKNAGDNTLIALGLSDIHTVSVVKDDKHKAKAILGQYFDSVSNKVEKDRLEKAIYIGNSEAHRFAIGWHRKRMRSIRK